MNIKQLRERAATLTNEERTLRTEHAGLLAAARESGVTEETTSRSDAIETRLTALRGEQDATGTEISNAERLADLERQSPSLAVAVTSGIREAVQDDPKRGFSNFGEFAATILDAGPGTQGLMNSPALMAAAGTGMVQGITADGGVLVPPAFSTAIWDGAAQQSESMMQYCDVMPIDPGVESVTFNAAAETSRANGSRWGGIQGYWKGELTQMSGTKPAFRQVKCEPQELYVFAYISDKLLRHAPGTASALLTRAAADEINFKLGDAIVNGDGAGKPLGYLGHASVVSVAKETGQAAATIVKENIDKMWARCHANYRGNAVWFINQDCEPALEQLSANVGTGGVPVYLPAGGVADAPNARLKGRPVVAIEYAQTLGTVGDITLGNLSSYLLGLRGTVDQAQSMHLKFDYAQTAFRFIFEADGQPWMASTITPFKGTNTLSPIVTLATRA